MLVLETRAGNARGLGHVRIKELASAAAALKARPIVSESGRSSLRELAADSLSGDRADRREALERGK